MQKKKKHLQDISWYYVRNRVQITQPWRCVD